MHAPTTIDSPASAASPKVVCSGALGGIDVRRVGAATRIACRPNCALSPSALGFALALPGAIALVVAIGFWTVGVSWILPFGGAEAALLALAFCWIARRAGDGEILTVTSRAVEVETTLEGRNACASFDRDVLRVSPRSNGLVALRGGRREVTVGRSLGFAARRQLLPALRTALREHGPSSAPISSE